MRLGYGSLERGELSAFRVLDPANLAALMPGTNSDCIYLAAPISR
jgi:hypothetical protein